MRSDSEREPPTQALITAWCWRWLGAEPTDVLFHQGHLSQVIGLRLSNGLAVVLKLRPPSERLASSCSDTSGQLGFPAPNLSQGLRRWER
jgi:hypothetical protein